MMEVEAVFEWFAFAVRAEEPEPDLLRENKIRLITDNVRFQPARL